MKRWSRNTVAACILWGTLSSLAQAQVGGYQRPQVNPHPTVSPYLNLNRGGNAAINYYGIVRPQLDTQRQLSQLQQDYFGLQAPLPMTDTTTGTGATMPATSRGLGGFFYYGHYFPMFNRGGGSGMGVPQFNSALPSTGYGRR